MIMFVTVADNGGKQPPAVLPQTSHHDTTLVDNDLYE